MDLISFVLNSSKEQKLLLKASREIADIALKSCLEKAFRFLDVRRRDEIHRVVFPPR